MSNQLVRDGNIIGYYDDDGRFVVCGELGTDEQLDKYSTEVQNGDGYYNSDGKFVRFNCD